MRVVLIVLVITGGCGLPSVENCPYYPESDCCTSDEDCRGYYGSDFPLCVQSAREIGGTCSACVSDRGCDYGQRCLPTEAPHVYACFDCDIIVTTTTTTTTYYYNYWANEHLVCETEADL